MSRKLLFENFLKVISEKKIDKHLNKFNTLCYKWTEVLWLSHCLDQTPKVLKIGKGAQPMWLSG